MGYLVPPTPPPNITHGHRRRYDDSSDQPSPRELPREPRLELPASLDHIDQPAHTARGLLKRLFCWFAGLPKTDNTGWR